MSTANCRPTGAKPCGWLAAHPDEAALVAAWRAQAESIRARYGAVAEEPVPERLKLDYLARFARMNRRLWMGAAAASLAAFLIGGGAGWFAHGAVATPPNGFGTLTADALEALQALRGRGASSGRGARRRTRPYDAMAVETARPTAADARPAAR